MTLIGIPCLQSGESGQLLSSSNSAVVQVYYGMLMTLYVHWCPCSIISLYSMYIDIDTDCGKESSTNV